MKTKHAQDIEKVLEYLHQEKTTYECCSMKDGIVKAGWFKDHSIAVAICAKEDAVNKPVGIFTTLNPCKKELYNICPDKLNEFNRRTKDNEITMLENILIDIDPDRRSGIASTKEERKKAKVVVKRVKTYLKKKKFPDPMITDSGNGYHLILKIRLENNEQNISLIQKFLRALDAKFSTPEVKVDVKVSNPARLVRLPGCLNRKGDNYPDRPYRRAQIIHIPKKPEIVSIKKLRAVASKYSSKTEKPDKPAPEKGLLDVPSYLKHYDVKVKKTKEYRGGTLFVLDKCPFNEKHAPGKAAIFQSSEGTLYYQCFHNSCRERRWADARRKISGDDPLGKFYKDIVRNSAEDEIRYSIMAGSEIIKQQIQETPLIKGLLEKNGSLLMVGQTGIMKSMLTLNMALNLAVPPEDKCLYEMYEIPEPVRTLFIQSENGLYGVYNRIKLMVDRNQRYKDALKKIFFCGMRNDCRITGDIRKPHFQEELKEMIFKSRAHLIVIDPLISFHGQNENDNVEIRKVLDALTVICDVTKVASVLIHHTGKSPSDGVFSGRGASAIADWASNILTLTKNDKVSVNHINVKHVKCRNFRASMPFTLEVSDTLQFKRVQLCKDEKNIEIVVSTLKKLNGEVEDQSTFQDELVKAGLRSQSTALRAIKKAVADDAIEEFENGSKKGYRLIDEED